MLFSVAATALSVFGCVEYSMDVAVTPRPCNTAPDDALEGPKQKRPLPKVLTEAEVDALLDVAKSYEASNVVVGVYAIEIAGSREPLTAREKVRAGGPTIPYGDDAVPSNRTDFDI